MASKKTIRKKTTHKTKKRTKDKPANRRALKAVQALTLRVQSELAQLKGLQDARTLSQRRLNLGLTNLKKDVARLCIFEFKI
jgi:hypothetical protein